jgi:hypothetical protein
MSENEKQKPLDLKTRTKNFALSVIRVFSLLPKTTEAMVMGKQMLRSGTSVGAHYREATRARSNVRKESKDRSSQMMNAFHQFSSFILPLSSFLSTGVA